LPSSAVLDTSAILALIFEEHGREVVAELLNHATVVSTVNLAEAHTKLIERGTQPEQAWIGVAGLGSEFSPFSVRQARIAAELIGVTRPLGLSLGDRACLALAIERKADVYTTDRTWKGLSLGIEINVIR
jgi:PIN domain nuclease of toxin-antitoxin system